MGQDQKNAYIYEKTKKTGDASDENVIFLILGETNSTHVIRHVLLQQVQEDSWGSFSAKNRHDSRHGRRQRAAGREEVISPNSDGALRELAVLRRCVHGYTDCSCSSGDGVFTVSSFYASRRSHGASHYASRRRLCPSCRHSCTCCRTPGESRELK